MQKSPRLQSPVRAPDFKPMQKVSSVSVLGDKRFQAPMRADVKRQMSARSPLKTSPRVSVSVLGKSRDELIPSPVSSASSSKDLGTKAVRPLRPAPINVPGKCKDEQIVLTPKSESGAQTLLTPKWEAIKDEKSKQLGFMRQGSSKEILVHEERMRRLSSAGKSPIPAAVKSHGSKKNAVDELRQAHAERRRKIECCVSELKKGADEMTIEKQKREEAEATKLNANEDFFMRWLADADENLKRTNEELEQERESASELKGETEKTVADLHAELASAQNKTNQEMQEMEALVRAHAVERESMIAEHTAQLQDLDADLHRTFLNKETEMTAESAKLLAEQNTEVGRAQCERDSSVRIAEEAEKEWRRKLDDAVHALSAGREEFEQNRAIAHKAQTDAEREIAKLRHEQFDEGCKTLAAERELGALKADVARMKDEVEQECRRKLNEARQDTSAVREELGQQHQLEQTAKIEAGREIAQLRHECFDESLKTLSVEQELKVFRREHEDSCQARHADAEIGANASHAELAAQRKLVVKATANGEMYRKELRAAIAASETLGKTNEVMEARLAETVLELQNEKQGAECHQAKSDDEWRREIAESQRVFQIEREQAAETHRVFQLEREQAAEAQRVLKIEREQAAEAQRVFQIEREQAAEAQRNFQIERAQGEIKFANAEREWEQKLASIQARALREAKHHKASVNLKVVQEELAAEKELTMKIQADGERNVLKTIESFWSNGIHRTSEFSSPAAADPRDAM